MLFEFNKSKKFFNIHSIIFLQLLCISKLCITVAEKPFKQFIIEVWKAVKFFGIAVIEQFYGWL